MHQDLILTDGNGALGKFSRMNFRFRDSELAAKLQLAQVPLKHKCGVE